MPGSGKYSGKHYRGHLAARYDLSQAIVQAWSNEKLREQWDAHNDAYDFDAVDALTYRNGDVIVNEMRRRGLMG